MATKTEVFNKEQLKKDVLGIRPGDTVRVWQRLQEKGKEKVQGFEGLVIARKHGKGISATITVRKIISGIGVERIFPIHSPVIKKIDILKKSKVRQAKLYYLRKLKGKKSRLKRKEIGRDKNIIDNSTSTDEKETAELKDKKEDLPLEQSTQEENIKEESTEEKAVEEQPKEKIE